MTASVEKKVIETIKEFLPESKLRKTTITTDEKHLEAIRFTVVSELSSDFFDKVRAKFSKWTTELKLQFVIKRSGKGLSVFFYCERA